jgi:hypothetical protein
VSTDSDGFAVKQDDFAIAHQGHGLAALAEFEIELERALADLRLNIGDIVPSRYIELNSDDEDEDDGRKLIKGVIVGDAHERIKGTFSDFTWPLQRALQRLQGTLR